jgi:peptidyl-prolyl cis-trans isomerase A (cyclophilin A)
MIFSTLLTNAASRLACVVACSMVLTACGGSSGTDSAPPPQQTKPKANPNPTTLTTNCSTAGIAAAASSASAVVCMLTSNGEIVIALESVKAPLTVTNFLKYVNGKFYDNTIFHRVVPGFVVQGGGLTTGFVTKPGELGPILLENLNGLSNLRGTVAMARTNTPDSATNQFFFNTVDNKFLDYSASVAGKNGYAVFGSVISGLATIDAINSEAQLYTGAETPATEVLLYWAKQIK